MLVTVGIDEFKSAPLCFSPPKYFVINASQRKFLLPVVTVGVESDTLFGTLPVLLLIMYGSIFGTPK